MVVIFIPAYLDEDSTYCAREYLAMERLEEKRLRMLKEAADRSHGLIIPIVFRGEEFLANTMKKRLYYNFEKYSLRAKNAMGTEECQEKIREIAKYIGKRVRDFSLAGHDPCADCSSFELPSEEDVRPWVREILLPAPWLVGNA
jgi:hypothetical protein